jgi:hypothetical protein
LLAGLILSWLEVIAGIMLLLVVVSLLREVIIMEILHACIARLGPLVVWLEGHEILGRLCKRLGAMEIDVGGELVAAVVDGPFVGHVLAVMIAGVHMVVKGVVGVGVSGGEEGHGRVDDESQGGQRSTEATDRIVS